MAKRSNRALNRYTKSLAGAFRETLRLAGRSTQGLPPAMFTDVAFMEEYLLDVLEGRDVPPTATIEKLRGFRNQEPRVMSLQAPNLRREIVSEVRAAVSSGKPLGIEPRYEGADPEALWRESVEQSGEDAATRVRQQQQNRRQRGSKTASVKFVVTKADEAALRELGYSQGQINKMKPATAQLFIERELSAEMASGSPGGIESVIREENVNPTRTPPGNVRVETGGGKTTVEVGGETAAAAAGGPRARTTKELVQRLGGSRRNVTRAVDEVIARGAKGELIDDVLRVTTETAGRDPDAMRLAMAARGVKVSRVEAQRIQRAARSEYRRTGARLGAVMPGPLLDQIAGAQGSVTAAVPPAVDVAAIADPRVAAEQAAARRGARAEAIRVPREQSAARVRRVGQAFGLGSLPEVQPGKPGNVRLARTAILADLKEMRGTKARGVGRAVTRGARGIRSLGRLVGRSGLLGIGGGALAVVAMEALGAIKRQRERETETEQGRLQNTVRELERVVERRQLRLQQNDPIVHSFMSRLASGPGVPLAASEVYLGNESVFPGRASRRMSEAVSEVRPNEMPMPLRDVAVALGTGL